MNTPNFKTTIKENLIKIKERLGHEYIDISNEIDIVIKLNEEVSEEMEKLRIAFLEYNKEVLEKINTLETENKELKLKLI
jgi:hypothetical protein